MPLDFVILKKRCDFCCVFDFFPVHYDPDSHFEMGI